MVKKLEKTIWISGRRKTSIARVKMSQGEGVFVFDDGANIDKVFPSKLDQEFLLKPFKVTGREVKGFDISFKVTGGGIKSQLVACQLALAKALVELDENLRPLLKDASLLTRDPRMKERKKYGLKRARKAPQYSKR